MSNIPDDLVPIPTQPWAERPDELPLDIEEVRTALWVNRGNIKSAADQLRVPSQRLRNFIKKSPYLSREQNEAREILQDLAEDVVYEALTDDDPGRKDAMARYILTNLGKSRGYGTGAGGVKLNIPGGGAGTVVIAWDDGTSIAGNDGDDAKVINHEAAE